MKYNRLYRYNTLNMSLKFIPRNIAVLGNGRGYKSFMIFLENNKIREYNFGRSINFDTDYGFVFFDNPLNQSSKHLYNLTHFGPKPIPYYKLWPKTTSFTPSSSSDNYYFLDLDANHHWPKILQDILSEGKI